MSLLRCDAERRGTAVRYGLVDCRVAVEEKLRDDLVAVLARNHERRTAVLVRLIDGGGAVDQKLRDILVTFLARGYERRHAVLVRLVDRGMSLEDESTGCFITRYAINQEMCPARVAWSLRFRLRVSCQVSLPGLAEFEAPDQVSS